MLPSAKKYLVDGGLTPKNATLTMITCFLVGAFGISVLSRILHSYIPHSVVDCDHGHGQDGKGEIEDEEAAHSTHFLHHLPRGLPRTHGPHDDESHRSYGTNSEVSHARLLAQQPSLQNSISSKFAQLVTGAKKECDDNGQCFGYSDTCSTECFTNVLQTRPRLQASKSVGSLLAARPSGRRKSQTTRAKSSERRPLLEDTNATTPLVPARSSLATPHAHSETSSPHSLHSHSRTSSISSNSTSSDSHHSDAHDARIAPQQQQQQQQQQHHHHHHHHHHVPTNVFLSLGLQTSCAIALHKIPEGFITYATNHANPTLGFSIFLALFIHNITEGFALALPLYLAINSRWKAMLWSTLLGGVSQPLGAGVAALWFRVAGRGERDGPGEALYGCMFAGTAGIMAMVALQLLGESLDLTHSKRLCFFGAFAGMGVLGLSSALTA